MTRETTEGCAKLHSAILPFLDGNMNLYEAALGVNCFFAGFPHGVPLRYPRSPSGNLFSLYRMGLHAHSRRPAGLAEESLASAAQPPNCQCEWMRHPRLRFLLQVLPSGSQSTSSPSSFSLTPGLWTFDAFRGPVKTESSLKRLMTNRLRDGTANNRVSLLELRTMSCILGLRYAPRPA